MEGKERVVITEDVWRSVGSEHDTNCRKQETDIVLVLVEIEILLIVSMVLDSGGKQC